jgi:hypothetical protein
MAKIINMAVIVNMDMLNTNPSPCQGTAESVKVP